MEDSGSYGSFDQQRAPPQSPGRVSGNYDNLSCGQIRDLCKARGYQKQDAKAALKTRLEATDAVERSLITEGESTMDTSSLVWGKRDRSIVEPPAAEQTQQQVEGKRPRGDVPAITMEVDLAVVQAHAQ